MKTLVSGSTGLIGFALVSALAEAGHQVSRLVRSRASFSEPQILWDPMAASMDPARLEGFDAVIHLSGENVAAGRWTAQRKAAIRDSRVKSTRLLCETLARLERPPAVLACASATGFYGNRGDEMLDESSPGGSTWVVGFCRDWEAAAEPARQKVIRVTCMRFGLVLTPRGGALGRMLPAFRLGLGGPLGDGRGWVSWVSLDDAVGAVIHAVTTAALAGPVNVVAPNPVTGRELAKTLGRVLRRPAILRVPAFALRLALGAMADELLLPSSRVLPRRLLETGFRFRHTDLEAALRHLLDR